jgi:transcriptional regulator with XRE-family HTH domain
MRAGVPTSTISRIEDDEMDPTYTMLERVLAAAGKELRATCAEPRQLPSLAGLTDAYDERRRGTKIDWTRLRGFLDWLARHPDQAADAIDRPPRRTGSVLDAILAGIAEQIATDAGLEPPRWTKHVPELTEPWTSPGTPRMIAEATERTPEPFRRRNLVLARDALWRNR